MCLRIQFCTHQRVCILHFLKKCQIRCTLMCMLLVCLTYKQLRPETHIQRQAALYDCLSKLLGDEVTKIEIVYGEEINILYWSDQSRQGKIKISYTDRTSPTNQPRKDPLQLYFIRPNLPQFQQSAWATPLWYLCLRPPKKTHSDEDGQSRQNYSKKKPIT